MEIRHSSHQVDEVNPASGQQHEFHWLVRPDVSVEALEKDVPQASNCSCRDLCIVLIDEDE